MALLDETLAYVLTQSTSFQAGSSTGAKIPIFLNRFPAEQPNTTIAFFESGGAAPINSLGASTALVRRPTIQVLSRSTSYQTARSNAETIWRMFNAVTNTVLPTSQGSTSTTFYHSITPNQDPIDMGRDAKERTLISCNFLVQKDQGA